MTSTLHFNFT